MHIRYIRSYTEEGFIVPKSVSKQNTLPQKIKLSQLLLLKDFIIWANKILQCFEPNFQIVHGITLAATDIGLRFL